MASTSSRIFLARRLAAAGASVAAGSALAARAHCMTDASHPELGHIKYSRSFVGELTPPRPAPGNDGTVCGPVAHGSDGVTWQGGPYGSWFLRLGCGVRATLPSAGQFGAALDSVTQLCSENKSAAYVCVPEIAMQPFFTEQLQTRGYAYHHYVAAAGENPAEFIYYKWNGDPSHDMVPSYATSIEGVGGVLLSPDEKKVLLVWEYGNWKAPGGAVDLGESKLVALRREVGEEVGLKVDSDFAPVYLGGWHKSFARDRLISDNFSAFALRATSEAFTTDDTEITTARWFDAAELLASWRKQGGGGSEYKVACLGEEFGERRDVSTSALTWLQRYVEGSGMKCTTTHLPKLGEQAYQIDIGGGAGDA